MSLQTLCLIDELFNVLIDKEIITQEVADAYIQRAELKAKKIDATRKKAFNEKLKDKKRIDDLQQNVLPYIPEFYKDEILKIMKGE